MKRRKFAKFRDDIINIDGVMTSQIIRRDVKILWRHICVKNVGIALKLCRLFDPVIAIICTNFASFHKVDRDLQKYRHLQISITYDVLDVFLRRTIKDIVVKTL